MTRVHLVLGESRGFSIVGEMFRGEAKKRHAGYVACVYSRIPIVCCIQEELRGLSSSSSLVFSLIRSGSAMA